jgi:Na+-driven multidrug efflux pump
MTFLSFIISLGLMAAMILLSPVFPKIYNTADNVRSLASSFMICYAIYLPFNALMNAFYFAIRSGGKTVITFLLDSAYMICITVPFTFVLAYFTDMNIIPLYALSLAIEIFKVLFGFYLIKRGDWAQNIVDENS